MAQSIGALSRAAVRWFAVCCLLIGLGSVVLTQEGCSCDPPPVTDAGVEPTPDATGPFPTSIRFIQPVAQEIISGQISIEVEIIDQDGIDEVQFVINGKPYLTEVKPTKNSTKESPRYAVQVATGFLPRGVMHLTVKTTDKNGDTAEKTIQVKTRERWVAAFGVGQVQQFLLREDRHLYLRVYRSEEDINRVTTPGLYDQVGSAVVTSASNGAASWSFLGLGEVFSDIAMDTANNIYFGARLTEKGTNRLLAIGPGDPKWTPEVPVKPLWETPLQEWSVKGKPLLQGDVFWVHLEKPAQGSDPAVSALARFTKADGKEDVRYTGAAPLQIIRGPFPMANDQVAIITRGADAADAGFSVQLIGKDGKLVWEQLYAGQRLDAILEDSATGRLYIGIEQRNGKDVESSAVLCLDPGAQKECWRKESGKSWPEKLVKGTSTLFVLRHPDGGVLEVAALSLADGSEKWKKEYKKYAISGILNTPDEGVMVFSVSLDDFQDPVSMYVERFDAGGQLKWKFENKQYYPLDWLLARQDAETLWVIVRNIDDKRLQLGHKILAISEKGERLFVFFEESRRHQFLKYLSKDTLYATSSSSQNVRIHNLIAR